MKILKRVAHMFFGHDTWTAEPGETCSCGFGYWYTDWSWEDIELVDETSEVRYTGKDWVRRFILR